MNLKKWTSEEIDIVRSYERNHKTRRDIQDDLEKAGYKRSFKAVTRKIENLGCKKAYGNLDTSKLPKVLIVDIETTPMGVWVWSLGKQYVGHNTIMKSDNNVPMDWHLISWSAKWLYDDKVLSDVITPDEAKNREDKRIVSSVWKLLDKADIVIAHNGDRFDLPKLSTRFIANGLNAPLPFKTIDTLKAARREFSFSSNKQDFLTKFLKIEQKLSTDFQLWIDCMRGDKKALDRMVKYNKHDVIGLEQLYLKLRPYMRSHPNIAVMMDEDACTVCGSKSLKETGKFYYTGTSKFNLYVCGGCNSPYIRSKENQASREVSKRSVAR